MSDTETIKKDEGLELARRMAEEEEGVGRRPRGYQKHVIPTIAVIWSLFQLSIASWLIMDSTFIRAIHLGFALLIVFGLERSVLETPKKNSHLLEEALPSPTPPGGPGSVPLKFGAEGRHALKNIKKRCGTPPAGYGCGYASCRASPGIAPSPKTGKPRTGSLNAALKAGMPRKT